MSKLDSASMLMTRSLEVASKGYKTMADACTRHEISDKLVKLTSNLEVLGKNKETILAVLGAVLVLHGAQFQNILLCALVLRLVFDRVTKPVMAVYSDVRAAHEKVLADAPAEGEMAKKLLKLLDSEKLTASAVEVLAALLACLLVMHGGLPQYVLLAHSLVSVASEHAENFVQFPGLEDMKPWTQVFLRLSLWAVCLPMAFLMGQLVLILIAAATGATMLLQHGAVMASVAERRELLWAGLVGFGAIWQLWTCAQGAGLYWVFNLAYLPAFVVEGILSLL